MHVHYIHVSEREREREREREKTCGCLCVSVESKNVKPTCKNEMMARTKIFLEKQKLDDDMMKEFYKFRSLVLLSP